MSNTNSPVSNTPPAEELLANTAPQEVNPLVLTTPAVEFLVQWDTVNKPAKQYLILQAHGGELREEIPFSDWESEPAKDWFAAYANEIYQFAPNDPVDLKMAWLDNGEEKRYLIFANITIQELLAGHFFKINAAEPLFIDEGDSQSI